jgi:hypothetical protein
MKLPLLKINRSSDIHEFIEFWSQLYHYPSEIDYDSLIQKEELSEDELKELFKWKNGMNLSGAKEKSFNEKIRVEWDWIKANRNASNLDLEVFKDKFKPVSTVWKIFLLHVINPKKYPIYDQHIHRAYNFMKGEDFSKISSNYPTNFRKEEFYFETYLPFVESLKVKDLKTMDDAFFAFGQFLNTRSYAKLLN